MENFGPLFGGQAPERGRGIPAAAGGAAARSTARRSAREGRLAMAAIRYELGIDAAAARRDRHARPPGGGRPRPRLPAAEPDRGLREVLQGRGPHPVPGPHRRGLPRTEHGRRRVHRGRPHPAQARAEHHRGPDRRRGAEQRRPDPLRQRGPAHRRGGDRRAPSARPSSWAPAASSSTRPCRASTPPTNSSIPLWETLQELGPAGHLPHRPERHGRRAARRLRDQAGLLQPAPAGRRRRGLPGLQIIMAHPSCRGRTRPTPSPRTRPTCSSTSPAGRPSTSRSPW